MLFYVSVIKVKSSTLLHQFWQRNALPATIFVCFFPLKEFEIELEGSQTLRLLCYEKCYNKTKQNKEDGESTDRIMGKGQIPVRHDVRPTTTHY